MMSFESHAGDPVSACSDVEALYDLVLLWIPVTLLQVHCMLVSQYCHCEEKGYLVAKVRNQGRP